LQESVFAPQRTGERIVTANRADGTISVIDVETDTVVDTIPLPPADAPAEPMYVVYVEKKKRVFVLDRANNRVVAYDARTFEVDGEVKIGAGGFHMWADGKGKQLWANNDIDNSSTVIDPKKLRVITTVPTPADLVARGGKPHDIVLDHKARFAYITVVGVQGESDFVVQFDTKTFQEVARAAVGKDPHVCLNKKSTALYTPCQGSNEVAVLDYKTLARLDTIPVPGAHGAALTRDAKTFYTTNLPGAHDDEGNVPDATPSGLFAIDTRVNQVMGEGVKMPFRTPHNIAITADSRKLYVTHSGAESNRVTIYTTTEDNLIPVFSGEVSVGFNPFGIAYVPKL
jgi:YVTN family beta-propeller protein